MVQKVWLIASQKGGVGKSTLGYGIAHLLSQSEGSKVLIADADYPQHSSFKLSQLRSDNGIQALPFRVAKCRFLADVFQESRGYTHIVIDGAPHASRDTLELAKSSNMVVLPTNACILDLAETINLAAELEAGGIPRKRIKFALVKAGSKAEAESARATIESMGWSVADGDLRFAIGYSKANDTGRSSLEVRHPGLRHKANTLLSNLIAI